MKRIILVSFVVTVFFHPLKCQNTETGLADYINPLVGTDSRFELSNGNTYPAIAVPWGMNFWTPKTNEMGNGWCYQYCSDKINGIKQTHQASPWLNDYGAFALFATTDKLVFSEEDRESWFSHKAETSKAYYYSVYLGDYDTKIEVTPTDRCALFRFSFNPTDSAFVIIDGFNKGSYIEIQPDKNRVIGYATNNHGGVPENFRNYFIIQFNKPFAKYYTVEKGDIKEDEAITKSDHSGGIIKFDAAAGTEVLAYVASSFISWEQAEVNFKKEIEGKEFGDLKAGAKQAWENKLSRILVEGGSEAQMRTFYTALYRTLLFPRKFYEINSDNKIIHYSPYDGKVHEGYMFTDNGFWDTFRAVFPFFNMMYREQNSKIMKGLANTYRESGWLPEWASPGHRAVMIGSNSASIIADAYLKGIDMPDIEILYEAIMKNAENEGPLHSVGRLGVDYYNRLGFIPYDVGINENTARTLEYAYDDFTIYRLAQKLEKPAQEIEIFKKRAMNYTHVFDPSIDFMRGKNKDGTFQKPFRPDKWGDAFTEGCSWHWTWCVFHDIQGLIDLMDGKSRFNAKLDSVFIAAPTSDHSYYGFQIHEITEMKIINMGQYAHGNQPIQHMPYLYNYSSQPWKSQYYIRDIMDRLYTDQPDGLCGDEDNGQTSAWYVFSALGFYPVAPGSDEYVMGSPLFKKATLKLENGNSFVIEANDNHPDNVYIRHATLNGLAFDRNYIKHDEVMKGGKLTLKMSPVPNQERATGPEAAPYSMSAGGGLDH